MIANELVGAAIMLIGVLMGYAITYSAHAKNKDNHGDH
jgi:archaellum component FlaF (FlaF/FlaG flagellin family)